MLSNYVLERGAEPLLLQLAKSVNPAGSSTVMGGPNISLEPERQIDYLDAHPDLDVYALGEGDFLALHAVQTFWTAAARSGASGETWRFPRRSTDARMASASSTETKPRHKEVDDDSVALADRHSGRVLRRQAGADDRDQPRLPLHLHLLRAGHPLVHQGPQLRDRSHRGGDRLHRPARSRSIRRTWARCASPTRTTACSSATSRSPATSARCRRSTAGRTYIDATTGKNRPDRIIQSVEKVSGALVLYQAVQSLDEDVLRNVKRETIKLEAYEQTARSHARPRPALASRT